MTKTNKQLFIKSIGIYFDCVFQDREQFLTDKITGLIQNIAVLVPQIGGEALKQVHITFAISCDLFFADLLDDVVSRNKVIGLKSLQ